MILGTVKMRCVSTDNHAEGVCMAETKKAFVSLIAVGRPNPQILNVDFLRNNDILPADRPPFAELFKEKQPFTSFVSTPVMANLVFGHIDFLIDEQRFQIRDARVSEWSETSIFDITKKYFDILPYTPLSHIGFNLNTAVTFESPDEARAFQELFVPADSRGLAIVARTTVVADVALRYSYPNNGARMTLTLAQLPREKNMKAVNFNYEFDFAGWPEFGQELRRVREIGEYADTTLAQLLGAL
jgi:hypothetical protein